MSVQRAQYEITSSEFVDWVVYLDEAAKIPTRQDLLLANIATECRRAILKHPTSAKVEDFLTMFEIPKQRKRTVKEKMASAKGFFGSLFSTYKGKK